MALTFIVPYAVEDPKREKKFTAEMEKAAVLCLSEARKTKPGILKGEGEDLEFIVKLLYPLWGVPWKDRCLIIDGLCLSSTTIIHDLVPKVEDFTEDLQRSSVSYGLFLETLKKHSQTFKEFTSRREEVSEAVIGDSSVLKPILSFVNQAEIVNETFECDGVFIPPKLHEEAAEAKADSFIGSSQRLQSETEALHYALKALKRETEHHKEKVSIEIELIWKDYEKRISEMKKLVDQKIKQFIKGKQKDTEKAVRLHEKRLKEILREEDRIREKIEELKRSLKLQLKKRKDQRRRYPKRSTTRIDRRIESYKGNLGGLSKRIRSLSDLKEKLQREGEDTLRGIEQTYLGAAAKENEKPEILEQSRNLEISGKREKIREIDESSRDIEAQIERLIQEKGHAVKEFEDRAVPLKVDETVLIGIPFYLVQYRSLEKTRIEMFPPVIAVSYDGIIKKIQKALLSFNLEARVQLLLNPRSLELSEGIFAAFRKSLETDPALKEKISEIGKSRNLLTRPNFKEEVTKGLSELEAEGSLSAKEREYILSVYAQ